MKKLLTSLLLTGSVLSFGQTYNPYVNLSSVNPAPLQPAEENGTGTLTFHIGNSGTSDLYLDLINPMLINLTLSRGVPDALIPISAVGGTFASKFVWLYDALSHSYLGTQIAPIAAGTDGTITVSYKVTANSSFAAPQNGFNVNIVPPAYSNGPNSTADDNINKYVYTVTVVSGNVFNDVNGMTDNLVNGNGTNAGGLNAVLINNLGNVAATTPVAADGTYMFTEVPNGDYSVLVTTANPAVGALTPSTSILPTNWVNTGEGTVAVGDGTINGLTSIVKGNSSVTNVNFGIEERPTAISSTTTTYNNPTGTNTTTVPATAFSGTDPSTGTVVDLTFTAFPTNATTITIGATTYDSGNFPPGGVTVPAPGGQPTPVVLVDPFDGSVTVTIPFTVTDNATFTSTNTGIVSIPFGVPLPLDLLAFDARKDGQTALLSWKTANETKVKHFEIEHSVTGSKFVKIGTVDAANKLAQNDYQFTDRNPATGLNFYRLKMVDMDGAFTFSPIKQLEFTDSKMDISLYPNPATNELNIEIKSGNCNDLSNAHVTLFDIAGRMVISKAWTEVCSNPVKVIDLSQLTDGAYYITIRNGADDAVLMSKKIVKTK
ncbi:MAG: T9SS type A sorting domain-containing protein [Taibaiella sp.]